MWRGDRLSALYVRRITIATARYEAGEAGGLAELQEITERCRANRLRALRRATVNLAHLMREEGDWQGSEELLTESGPLDDPAATTCCSARPATRCART
jgi:hypothetical protein